MKNTILATLPYIGTMNLRVTARVTDLRSEMNYCSIIKSISFLRIVRFVGQRLFFF